MILKRLYELAAEASKTNGGFEEIWEFGGSIEPETIMRLIDDRTQLIEALKRIAKIGHPNSSSRMIAEEAIYTSRSRWPSESQD